ncbi:MAG: putative ATPase [Planctomycetota bacterium]|jgi:putative ATPase
MSDLFGEALDASGGIGPASVDPLEFSGNDAPLADRMRPTSIEDYIGQRQLVGSGKILAEAFAGESQQSLILWGPPGVGKTTLARLLASRSSLPFVPYSAVLSGIKEIRRIMAEARDMRARNGQRTLLFIDEIHRFNKAQQDAFLPFVERGDVLLIGATTENPSFEVISALLSRCRTLVLEPLTVADLCQVLTRALQSEQGLAGRVTANPDALEAIARAADGDARRALTVLESAATLAGDGGCVDEEVLREALQRKVLHYDKSGEEHFNLISALQKSIRNSDADATLYWLTRMMEAGEDGNYLSRRLIRIASEDIGLADPFALRISLDAAEAFHRLGYPEGRLALVQAAVYLARAPKSNALYTAESQAREDVQSSSAEPVPLHLRNATTKLMREAGYGSGYRYAHDDPAARQEMSCMPDSLQARRYFSEPRRSRNQAPTPRSEGSEPRSNS